MRVRFRTAITSTDWSYQDGEVVACGSVFSRLEIPHDYAAKWLSSGVVERVDEDTIEAATAPAVATTAKRPRHTRRAGQE